MVFFYKFYIHTYINSRLFSAVVGINYRMPLATTLTPHPCLYIWSYKHTRCEYYAPDLDQVTKLYINTSIKSKQ